MKINCFYFGLLLFVFTGCISIDKQQTMTTPVIEGVYVLFDNTPSNYFGNNELLPNSCSMNFFFFYSGILKSDMIDSVGYNTINSSFSTKVDEDFIVNNEKLTQFVHSENETKNVMYIGEYTFWIKLKNGKLLTYDYIVPAPGQKSIQKYSIVYTSDYKGAAIETNSIPFLSRPEIESCIQYNNMIELKYSVNDNRCFDVLIMFYDSEGNLSGYISLITSDTNREYSQININNIKVDGSINSYSISTEKIVLVSDNSIDKVSVKIYDKLRYLDRRSQTIFSSSSIQFPIIK